MLSDPFYTFAFESIYISCQGCVKEQWAGSPFIWAYVTFTSLTSFLWGPTWFRKVSGYQLFQCPVLGGSQQCNPTKSKTKWMKWPFEHTQGKQKQHCKHAGKPVCALAANAMTVVEKTWRPNRYLHSDAKLILSVSLKDEAELLCSSSAIVLLIHFWQIAYLNYNILLVGYSIHFIVYYLRNY